MSDESNIQIPDDDDEEIGGKSGGEQAWLATYGDMVTLLLCFFVLLFSMSKVSEDKYIQLTESLKSALGKQEVPEAGTHEGLKFQESESGKKPQAVDELGGMVKKELDEIVSEVDEFILYNKLGGKVKIEVDDLGATITISDVVIFPSGEATMTRAGYDVMSQLSDILKQFAYHIKIQGQTDNVPVRSNNQYKSNWELSANRACEIVHFLIENGVNPELLSAEGYAEYKPIAENDTPEGRAQNRRVEIVYERQSIASGITAREKLSLENPAEAIRKQMINK